MTLLIDGYNLLNAVGIVGPRVGRGGLEQSRTALLNFLAESLDPEEIPQTTIVFDATEAPPGLPRVTEHRGLTVRFAAQYADADSLIEELIRAESAPRRLTVVSSDHRVQRAARRRKARAVDSDVWYAATVQRWRRRQLPPHPVPAKPEVPLLEEDVAYWLGQFGDQPSLEELTTEQATQPDSREKGSSPTGPPAGDGAEDKPSVGSSTQVENPFPPGYGDDLLQDEVAEDPYNPFPPGYADDLE